MAYMTNAELKVLNFKHVGENVRISRQASIYNSQNISLGDHVRIDDFCILSAGEGGIELGSYVHIGAYSMLVGKGRIVMSDFSGLSARVNVYSSTDDYSGNFMTNPTVPSDLTNVISEQVIIGRHAIIGCGSVILPGVNIGDGAAVGALSLIVRDCKPLGVYSGNPARQMQNRANSIFELEKELLASHNLCDS